MAFDPGLAERLRDLLAPRRDITEKKMFGGLAFLSHDYMFIGISGTALMARLGPDNYLQALTTPHVREMDFTGKPMRGYVFIDPPAYENDIDLAKWVNLCLDFVGTLPPKKKTDKAKPPH